MTGLNKAIAFAPASVGNVAVGFDILGHSLHGIGDTVSAERIPLEESLVVIEDMACEKSEGQSYNSIPSEVMSNTAGRAAHALLESQSPRFSVKLRIKKGIPLSAGMGGSAASAVAAVVATNALFDKPLPKKELLQYALLGESVASGAFHADNVAPCLLGGLCLIVGEEVISVPLPPHILCVLVHPDLQVETKSARAVLNKSVPLATMTQQAAYLAAFIHACHDGDTQLMGRVMKDILIEPQRSTLIPCFTNAKNQALQCGAISFSISGAGPSVFAWSDNELQAKQIKAAIMDQFSLGGIASEGWISPIGGEGAMILPSEKDF